MKALKVSRAVSSRLGLRYHWLQAMRGFSFSIVVIGLGELLFNSIAFAQVTTIGGMATLITGSFGTLAKLITAVAYILGLGFSLGAVLKFRQHRDNPTQIPIGVPFILLFIASALLFFSQTLQITAITVFGTTASQGSMGTGGG